MTVTEVNETPAYAHLFLIHYDPDVDDRYTGYRNVQRRHRESLSSFEMAGSRLSFQSLTTTRRNYTWYPAFMLNEE